jgi:uncharacterized membrane protein YqgA involved in biofilm formation
MILLGSVVNGVLIIAGSLIGMLWKNIPERIKDTVTKAMALAIFLIGIEMGLKYDNILIVVISLAIGAVIGEYSNIDDKINNFGYWVEKKLNTKEEGSFARGFVTATLLFCIGAMGILGGIESGLKNEHNIQITKGIIDGFMSIILTSTLGFGVLFSFVPVVIYQGFFTVISYFFAANISDELLDIFIANVSGCGGVLLLAISLNVLGLTKIKIGNLLPAILVVFLLTYIVEIINL